MDSFVTASGSTVLVDQAGSWVADWDWFEEKDCCVDMRPIATTPDEDRLIVTVCCDCCGEFDVIANKEPKDG